VTRVAADTADTRNVYDIGSADALAAALRLKRRDIDALLLSGTGMPTLRAIGEISRAFGKPALSSNLCLAWALSRRLHLEASPPWDHRAVWETRLQDL
jgi:maleate isomerase